MSIRTHAVIKESKLAADSKCHMNREGAGKRVRLCLILCVLCDRAQMSTRGVRGEAREMEMLEEETQYDKAAAPCSLKK